MFFYRITAEIKNLEELITEEEKDQRPHYWGFTSDFNETSEELFQLHNKDRYIFVTGVRNIQGNCKISFGMLSRGKKKNDAETLIGEFAKKSGLKLSNECIEETTLKKIQDMLRESGNKGYLNDTEAALEAFDIDALGYRCGMSYEEALLDPACSMQALKDRAREGMIGNTMLPELERIEMGTKNTRAAGHPAHYLVCCRNGAVQREKLIYTTLLDALYANGRISSKRYVYIEWDSGSSRPGRGWESLYRSCTGGALVVKWFGHEEYENDIYASPGADIISGICAKAARYRNEVLTVIVVAAENESDKRRFTEKMAELASTSLIELKEDVVFYEEAKNYLKKLASEKGVRVDKKLFGMLAEGKGYTAGNLKGIFGRWYDEKLRTSVYPQYKNTVSVTDRTCRQKPKGKAVEELNRLIGLDDAKHTLEKALNFYKMQKLFRERGINTARPAMHMVFTGNPGTAKTTAARLFAHTMKDNGLLEVGDLFEIGRSDLVGKYVGWTAKIVKDIFKKARGSVLFIDEAYSLVDDHRGMFGDEAINTIVQEMENNRDNMVVIFAGYPDKMEGFLRTNPGLRSRIAFHVNFPDYSSDDLVKIAELTAENNGLVLSEGTHEKLLGVFEAARRSPDFGNGRYVRNLIENARMEMANRLSMMKYEDVTDDDLRLIMPEDIAAPDIGKTGPVIRKIGFCA